MVYVDPKATAQEHNALEAASERAVNTAVRLSNARDSQEKFEAALAKQKDQIADLKTELADELTSIQNFVSAIRQVHLSEKQVNQNPSLQYVNVSAYANPDAKRAY